jgi:SRSO17 transposase
MDEHVGSRTPRTARHHELEELTSWLFEELPRADQRRWAGSYLRGLLETPGKKSVRRMGSTVSTSDTAWQSLHQIVNASTWPWQPVRRQLAAWAAQHAPARALILAPVVIPKRGRQSAGVHRRFDPATGRTAGCQWALGLFLATAHGTLPVDWRLHLPDRWSEDEELRERACIPETERDRSLHALATDLLGSRIALRHHALPVVAQAATPDDARALAAGLAECGRSFALAVPAATPLTTAQPPGTHRQRVPEPATSAQHLRRHGGDRTPAVPLAAVPPSSPPVAPPHVHLPGCSLPLHPGSFRSRLGGRRQTWLTSMNSRRLREAADLADLADLHDTVAHTTEVMATCGLHDFEGRSFPGWHRHMTLVSAASTHRLLEAAYANDGLGAAA